MLCCGRMHSIGVYAYGRPCAYVTKFYAYGRPYAYSRLLCTRPAVCIDTPMLCIRPQSTQFPFPLLSLLEAFLHFLFPVLFMDLPVRLRNVLISISKHFEHHQTFRPSPASENCLPRLTDIDLQAAHDRVHPASKSIQRHPTIVYRVSPV